MTDRRKYDVGFGKPPKHTQFKKGQSGNPNGRPKGARNLKTDLFEELQTIVLVTEGSRKVRISKQLALVKVLLAKAHKDCGVNHFFDDGTGVYMLFMDRVPDGDWKAGAYAASLSVTFVDGLKTYVGIGLVTFTIP